MCKLQISERFYKLIEFAKTYKTIYRLWNGLAPEVRILRGDYAETILKSSKHIEKSFIYDFVKPWLGEGLLIAKGIIIIAFITNTLGVIDFKY